MSLSPNFSRSLIPCFLKPLLALAVLQGGYVLGQSEAIQARDKRWNERNSPEAQEATAKAFAGILNVGADFQSSGLASRVELRPWQTW